MSIPRQTDPAKQARMPRVEVYWHAVTYRSVIVYVLLLLTIGVAASYLVHPDWYGGVTERLSRTFGAAPDGAPVRGDQSGALRQFGWQSGSQKGELGELGKCGLSHHARQRRPGPHRRRRSGSHHLRGRNHLYREKRLLRHRRGKRHRQRPQHQRRRAYHLRRGRFGHRHVAVAEIQG